MNIYIVIIAAVLIAFKLFSMKNSLKKDDVKAMLENGGKIIDVRTAMEFKSGHVKNAKNIELSKILNGVKKAKISKDTPIILYCASGSRSSVACSTLKGAGYTNVHNGGTAAKLNRVL